MLFDMDGTLIDSEKLWDVALRELAERYGGRLSATARLAMVGSDLATTMRLLHDDLDQPWRDPRTGADWVTRRVAQLFGAGLPWRPGAEDLLRAVRSDGFRTALVTSTERPLVDIALRSLGRHNFDVVVCGDEVSATKPDPAPYLSATAALGVAPRECVAVEDSPAGVASAYAARVAVLAVPAEVALTVPPGVHVRDSLVGVTTATLVAVHREALSAGHLGQRSAVAHPDQRLVAGRP
ncbi:HAD family phosphatase [Solwaraspora sp. WMMD406]|uniref:HAD family hydrolase n=1 Tax=Solwaraspora sp. WMMD406 TaxID=3016095 RepID=UPI002415ACE1|nr:HAD family phosphatase [Solwaraspora sp. WMMD406]MDG4766246.1 HAD family phosphatase [Solwaraspora sp. WMMD406]